MGLALALAGVARADFAPIAPSPGSYRAEGVEPTFPASGDHTSPTTDQVSNNTSNGWYEII
jgi:hypothetical protein